MGKRRAKAEPAPGTPRVRPQPPSAAPARPRRRWVWALAALFSLWITLETYGPALRGTFVFDDLYLPFLRPGLEDAPLRSWLGRIRPVLMASFWISRRLSGPDPYAYHLFNVLAHWLTGALIYLAARKLLSLAGEQRLRREILAGFAAGIFLLHPVQTESVAYVASRSEVLSGLFFFAALVVFLYRRRAAISWSATAGVLAFYAAAVLTKEHTAVLAALLLLTDYFWNPGFSLRGIRANWRLYLPLAAAGAAGLGFVWSVLRTADTAGFAVREFTWYQYFFTQCRAIWLYLRLFLLPYDLNLDRDFPISRTWMEHGAAAGFVGLILLVGAAWRWRRRYPLAAYGLLAAFLTLAPTSSVVPILDPVAERRMYPALFGLAIALTELVRRWKTTPVRLGTAAAALLTVAAALTWQRNHVWSDAIALWQDTAAKSPAKQRPRFQLAYAYYEAGRCRDAVREYARAAQLGPQDYRLLVDWAMALDCAEQPEVALEKLQQAAAKDRTAHVYALMGMVYGKQGRRQEALDALAEAERLDPTFDMTYVYRGNVYQSAGETQAAAREYQRALALNPRNEAARQAWMQTSPQGRR